MTFGSKGVKPELNRPNHASYFFCFTRFTQSNGISSNTSLIKTWALESISNTFQFTPKITPRNSPTPLSGRKFSTHFSAMSCLIWASEVGRVSKPVREQFFNFKKSIICAIHWRILHNKVACYKPQLKDSGVFYYC